METVRSSGEVRIWKILTITLLVLVVFLSISLNVVLLFRSNGNNNEAVKQVGNRVVEDSHFAKGKINLDQPKEKHRTAENKSEKKKEDKSSEKKDTTVQEIVTDTLTVAGAAGTATFAALIPAKIALGAAIPTLMSAGATVVAGVGSIMPWWIAPIQAASMVGLAGLAAPAVIIGGTVAAGYGGYQYYSSQCDDAEA